MKRQVLVPLALAATLLAAGGGVWWWQQSRVKVTSPAVAGPTAPAVTPNLPLHPVVARIVREGPSMPYLKFNYLIKELPTDLPAHDVEALAVFISTPKPPAFSEGQWGSLTNDIQEALTVQTVPSRRVAEALFAISRDPGRSQMQRDYALQHIGGFAIYLVHTRENRHATLPDFFPALVAELKAAVADPTQPWAGTAINLLDGLLRAAEYRNLVLAELTADQLLELSLPLVTRTDAPLNTRIPALQLATRRKSPEGLLLARAILADPQAPMLLVVTAAAVLGEQGTRDDLPLLEKATASRHAQPAIRTALQHLRTLP